MPEAELDDPRPHSPREALLLLVASMVLVWLTGLLPQEQGGFLGDIGPALFVLAWVLPAYLAYARRRRGDPLVAHAVLVRPRNLGQAAGVSLAILVAFVVGFALLMRALGKSPVPLDAEAWVAVLERAPYWLVFVALPEEYFFRGVLQPSLEREDGPAWRLLGVPFGRGALLAAALFALCHVAVPETWGQPYRLAVFFPALWFAWVRAATGSVVPAAIAHALANTVQDACFTLYGVGGFLG